MTSNGTAAIVGGKGRADLNVPCDSPFGLAQGIRRETACPFDSRSALAQGQP
jgi:hypothetical protein